MGDFDLHTIKFYNFHPEAIHCLAYNSKLKLLALSRANGSIELWSCHGTNRPFKQNTLIGQKGSSVESLVWCDGRLFTAGLNGFILEYDIASFQQVNQAAVTGGPTWCLALSPDKKYLAAGTEEGFVCIFEVLEEGLTFSRILNKQKSRVLSIGWHADSDHIVTGSVNYVHLYSLKTEQTIEFPVVKSKNPNVETIVWCVTLLHDMTIVTGDSRGLTCFWDGTFGTSISTMETHKSAVLAMVAAPDSKSLYLAGADASIMEARLVESGSRKLWMKGPQRRIHTHDVRALAITKEGKLFSGGVDTDLVLSFYPPKTAFKFPATPPRGYVSVGRNSHTVLLGYRNRLELWKLGRGRTQHSSDNHHLSLVDDRMKLMEIQLKDKDVLQFCALSPQAKRIAYVSAKKIRVYSFTSPEEVEGGRLHKISCVSEKILPSQQILWISEEHIFSATQSNILQVLSVAEEEVEVVENLTLPSEAVVRMMVSSSDGAKVAVLDSNNNVTVYSTKNYQLNPVQLPRAVAPVRALAVDQNSVFICADTFAEYNLKTLSRTHFGNEISQTMTDIKSLNTLQDITLKEPNLIFLHSTSNIYVFNRSPSVTHSRETARKTMKIGEQEKSARVSAKRENMTVINRSNHILHFSHIKDQDLLSIEVIPSRLIDNLPSVIKMKRFGTK